MQEVQRSWQIDGSRDQTPLIFSLESGHAYAQAVCGHLNLELSSLEERSFEDGEHKIRPLVSVRGRSVFVVQSLYGDATQSVNEKLCRLLFFVGALKDASAASVTAVVPYLCYARKDRRTKSRDPVTIRYLACLFEAVGVDRMLVLDVHNLAAFQNAFRCPTEHLEGACLFADYFYGRLEREEPADQELVVMSPDVGGVKRAERFREVLSSSLPSVALSTAFMDKKRSGGVVSGETVVGEVTGKIVIIIDDLISSGATLLRAAQACAAHGADKIYAVATHGLFMEGSERLLSESAIERVIVTDTIPPFRLSKEPATGRLLVLSSTELIAEAVRRIHLKGSIVELLESS